MALFVNGEQIDETALRDERRAIRRLLAERMPGESPAALDRRAAEWARENLIEQTLLRQAALRDPEPIPAQAIDEALRAASREESGERRREIELKLRIDRLVVRLTSHVGKPRHKDLVEHYKKNRESYLAPEAVHARHIVKNIDETNTEESARNAIEQVRLALESGSTFEEVADGFSDCPGRGGDLGYFTRGQMVDEFEGVAFALPVGAVSDIFRTPFGFHIVRVYARRPEGILPFEAVSGAIGEELFARKRQKAVEQYVDALLAKAQVEDRP